MTKPKNYKCDLCGMMHAVGFPKSKVHPLDSSAGERRTSKDLDIEKLGKIAGEINALEEERNRCAGEKNRLTNISPEELKKLMDKQPGKIKLFDLPTEWEDAFAPNTHFVRADGFMRELLAHEIVSLIKIVEAKSYEEGARIQANMDAHAIQEARADARTAALEDYRHELLMTITNRITLEQEPGVKAGLVFALAIARNLKLDENQSKN